MCGFCMHNILHTRSTCLYILLESRFTVVYLHNLCETKNGAKENRTEKAVSHQNINTTRTNLLRGDERERKFHNKSEIGVCTFNASDW